LSLREHVVRATAPTNIGVHNSEKLGIRTFYKCMALCQYGSWFTIYGYTTGKEDPISNRMHQLKRHKCTVHGERTAPLTATKDGNACIAAHANFCVLDCYSCSVELDQPDLLAKPCMGRYAVPQAALFAASMPSTSASRAVCSAVGPASW